MEENHKMENRDAGNTPEEKYIHVNDIKTEKLDQDEAYKKSEGGKMPENDTETILEEKTEKDQSQGDDTVGIP